MVVPNPSVPPGTTETSILSQLNDCQERIRLLENRVNYLEAEIIRLREAKGESSVISVNASYSVIEKKTVNEANIGVNPLNNDKSRKTDPVSFTFLSSCT